MGKHNEIGKEGENLAASFLEKKSYRILEQNWRSGRAELDIVAYDGTTLVFVEVKTRTDDIFSRPEQAVNLKKQRLMTRAALAYMQKINHEWAIRFDIVSVILRGSVEPQIELFKDAFFPELNV